MKASRKVDFGPKSLTVGAEGKATLVISNEKYAATFEGDIDPGGNEKLSINGDGEICPKIKVRIHAGIFDETISKKVCLELL